MKLFNKIILFDILDSTNDYLIALYKKFNIQSELVVVANKQKKGRGRMAKEWFSDSDSLIFSFSILLNQEVNKLKIHSQGWKINMAVSLAIVKVLKRYKIQSYIKYPNDIIVENKKIAGILTEIISVKNKKYCIVGLGMNVNNQSFPSKILNAISMKKITIKHINKKILFKSLLLELDFLLKKENFIKSIYMSFLYGRTYFIPCIYKGIDMDVKILNVNSQGLLTILEKKSDSISQISDVDIKFLF